MKRIVVLTGAGVSAESGIETFRDANGLWEGHDVMEVASPDGFSKNPGLVLEFYNQRRRKLFDVEPNAAHYALVDLEAHFETIIVTQNIDDLHERSGSSHVIHLHGELLKSRSTSHPHKIYSCTSDIKPGDMCEMGSQLRPHIVWFGEGVPMLEKAIQYVVECDMLLIIGSSMQVYPAASLAGFAPMDAMMHYVDPKPSLNYELSMRPGLNVIPKPATIGVPEVVQSLITTHLR